MQIAVRIQNGLRENSIKIMASFRVIEPKSTRLGATLFGSCLIVRRASKCPQTRMNTGFFIELPVAEYLKISPNIGSFCTQIEPAIRQILDRFLAVTPNTGDSLELSCPIIWRCSRGRKRKLTSSCFYMPIQEVNPLSLNLPYYYGHSGEQYAFFRIPKLLITDSRFDSVSSDAKLLYGLLLARM